MTGVNDTRLGFFDALRGFTMISMALFHGTYDLAYIYGVSIPWFVNGPVQDIWRASISWVFLFVAGWMCSVSHDNFKRSFKYAAAAFVVWIATSVASVDNSINFGIIYCMAACTLTFALTKSLLTNLPAYPTMAILLILFGLTWNIPHHIYDIPGLAWLGFPDAGFVSGDYYPLIPFIFMFLAGYMASRGLSKTDTAQAASYPRWMYRHPFPALEALGRHALPFYLIHQPLILAVIDMAYSVL